MTRLTQDVVEEREAWVRKQFMKNPRLSGPVAADMVLEQFGIGMRPQRIYQIRRIVRAELQGGLEHLVAPKRYAMRVTPYVELIPCPPGTEEAVANALRMLREKHYFAGQVEVVREGFVVVSLDIPHPIEKS